MGRKRNESGQDATGLLVGGVILGALLLSGGAQASNEDKINESVGLPPRKDWSDLSIDPDRIPQLDPSRLRNPDILYAPNGQAILPNINDAGTTRSLEHLTARSFAERFADKWKMQPNFSAKDMANMIKNRVNGIFKYPVDPTSPKDKPVRLSLAKAKLYDDTTARRFTILIESVEDLEFFEVYLACLMLATFNPTKGAPDATKTAGIKEMIEFFGYHRFVFAENTNQFRIMQSLVQNLPRTLAVPIAGEGPAILSNRVKDGEVVEDPSIIRYYRNGWGWGLPVQCIPWMREGLFNESTFGKDEGRVTGKTFAELDEMQRRLVQSTLQDGNMMLFERAAVRFSNVVMMMASGASPSHISDIFGKIGGALLALGGGALAAMGGKFDTLIQGIGAAVKVVIEFIQALNAGEEMNKATQNMIDDHVRRVMDTMNFDHTRFLGQRLSMEANWGGFRIGKSRTLARFLRNFVLQNDGLWVGCGGTLCPQIPMFARMPKFGVIAFAGNKENFGVRLRFDPKGEIPIGWYPFKITHADQMVEIIDYEVPTSMRVDEFDLGTKALKFA